MLVDYSRTALRGLRKLPKQDALALTSKISTYAETGAGDVIKLKGSEAYRLRHGNYRAIFHIEDNILVVRIAHRREVY